MAIAFAQTKDLFIHDLAVTGAGTTLTSTTLTKDNAWEIICTLFAELAAANAIVNDTDYSGKRPALVLNPEAEGILKQAPQYFANAFGNEVLRKGQIGIIGGFDVFRNTNISGEEIVALTSDAIFFAEQITETDMVKNLPKEMIEPLIKTIPLGRIGEPRDVANAFLYLSILLFLLFLYSLKIPCLLTNIPAAILK